MNLNQVVKVPMAKAMQDATLHVKVTGVRRWKARVAVGAWIVRLGAKVIGVRCEMSIDR
jgi:hypothetical protein